MEEGVILDSRFKVGKVLVIGELEHGEVVEFGEVGQRLKVAVVHGEVLDVRVFFQRVLDLLGDVPDADRVQLQIVQFSFLQILLYPLIYLSQYSLL